MSNKSHTVAEVIVDVPISSTDRPFDYAIPEQFHSEVKIGSRVQVPFGPRKLVGYVVGLKTASSTKRLKEIMDVMDLIPPLTSELVQLSQKVADEYICHTITALQSMIPAVLKGKYQKIVRLHPSFSGQEDSLLDLTAQDLFDFLQERKEATWDEILQIPHVNHSLLRQLAKEKRIIIEERVGDRITRQKMTWVRPKEVELLSHALEKIPARAVRQREVIQYFIKKPEETLLSTLLAQVQTTRSTIQKLVEQGYIVWEEREQFRDPYAHREFQPTNSLPLTEEQQKAFASIVSPIREHRYHPILLHGVTGSGKTEIYLQSIEEVLSQGREAIVLVPEISLTPQMVERFKGRFGEQVAVLHSGLSSGERYDEWRKIRLGEVKVAIGARSAIFAPFQKLGLIIIDEEHESSYKQEENPKYHARDIAIWRAQEHGATLVLGSATPAIESYYAARTGKYEWVTLKKRVHGRPFPRIEVVDMRVELRKGNRTMFSTPLREALVECVERGEQAVLFLNRRGFSTFVMCRECGETLMCPHCDISLTYHQTNRTVRCHYCGYAENVPTVCPSCNSQHIRHFGTGTQRVEEELIRRFPGLRVIRMDVDTTSRKGAHEKLLTAFGEGKADVLLGTQMIAKGLDFPRVTLVGVITADTMLHLPDFRAAERTFQLLTQVSGRAGRHEQPGKVVIQTYNADHYSIEMAANHQIDDFYRQECLIRKQHQYPPFCGLVILLLSHSDRVQLMKASQETAQFVKERLHQECEVLGPVPAVIPRIKDRFRIQIMLKYKASLPVISKLKQQLRQIDAFFDDKELRISIDREGIIV